MQLGSCWAPELLLRQGTVLQLISFLLFPWVDLVFLKLILSSTIATWEPGIPESGCKFPGSLRFHSLLEIDSLGRSRHVGLPRIGSLDRSRHVNLLGSLDWQILKKVEVWQPSKDQIPRQVKAGWPPGSWARGSPSRQKHDNLLETRSLSMSTSCGLRLELGVPKVSNVTSAGKD